MTTANAWKDAPPPPIAHTSQIIRLESISEPGGARLQFDFGDPKFPFNNMMFHGGFVSIDKRPDDAQEQVREALLRKLADHLRSAANEIENLADDCLNDEREQAAEAACARIDLETGAPK